MELAERFAAVRGRIAEACQRSGRPAAAVTLVAVSKGHPPPMVDAAVALGQLNFAENRVQEARAKIPLCSGRATWHMIGHLQTNKCRDVVQFFEWIHSVDSLRLAEELSRWATRVERRLKILLEVNVAGESTKFGFLPESMLVEIPRLAALSHLDLSGLMTMAPWTPEPERTRPVFRRLRELQGRCQELLERPLPHLSMGMSGDFDVAIEEGSTLVRIGTALFGKDSRA